MKLLRRPFRHRRDCLRPGTAKPLRRGERAAWKQIEDHYADVAPEVTYGTPRREDGQG